MLASWHSPDWVGNGLVTRFVATPLHTTVTGHFNRSILGFHYQDLHSSIHHLHLHSSFSFVLSLVSSVNRRQLSRLRQGFMKLHLCTNHLPGLGLCTTNHNKSTQYLVGIFTWCSTCPRETQSKKTKNMKQNLFHKLVVVSFSPVCITPVHFGDNLLDLHLISVTLCYKRIKICRISKMVQGIKVRLQKGLTFQDADLLTCSMDFFLAPCLIRR